MPTQTKIAVASILCHWTEGRCDKENVEYASFEDAQKRIAPLWHEECEYSTKPDYPGGYCKSKWTVRWADGFEWTIRLDIDPETHILAVEIRREWEVYGGVRKPGHMNTEQYRSFWNQFGKPELAECLNKYALE